MSEVITIEPVKAVVCPEPDILVRLFVYAIDGGGESFVLRNLCVDVLLFARKCGVKCCQEQYES
jgi:hypothetical protein